MCVNGLGLDLLFWLKSTKGYISRGLTGQSKDPTPLWQLSRPRCYIRKMLLIDKFDASEILLLANQISLEVKDQRINLEFIDCLTSASETSSSSLSYLSDIRFLSEGSSFLEGMVLIDSTIQDKIDFKNFNASFVIVNEAKYLFCYINKIFNSKLKKIVENNAATNSDQNVDPSACIERNVVIAEDVKIGANCHIYPNVVLLAGVRLGERVIVKANTTIGGNGFGYAVRKGYPPLRVPHIGGVSVGNDVEIGSGTQIDRGTFGDTIIGNDVKIDNLVHIAHNVKIGERSLVIAQAEISGSVEIGSDVWIGPQVSIREKIKIGSGSLVGIGSVVIRDIPEDVVAVGIPARVIRKRTTSE